MRSRRGAANRQAIFAAAYELIATRGYAHATTAEICARAQVSSGTFFHYFPTKEDVLVALLIADPAQDQAEDLAGIIEEVVAEAADPLHHRFVLQISTLMTSPLVSEALARDERARRARLATALDAAAAAGQVRTDLHLDELLRRAELLLAGFEAVCGNEEGRCEGSAEGRLADDAATLRGLFADALDWTG